MRRAARWTEWRRCSDSVNGAILHSIKVRPYTTLAIAGLIGFAYGAFRR